jgi:uncharacterized protein YuzE
MKPTIKYRADDNAAYIRLSGDNILESSEVAPNVIFDYDVDGRIVGIELLIPQEAFIAALKVDS